MNEFIAKSRINSFITKLTNDVEEAPGFWSPLDFDDIKQFVEYKDEDDFEDISEYNHYSYKHSIVLCVKETLDNHNRKTFNKFDGAQPNLVNKQCAKVEDSIFSLRGTNDVIVVVMKITNLSNKSFNDVYEMWFISDDVENQLIASSSDPTFYERVVNLYNTIDKDYGLKKIDESYIDFIESVDVDEYSDDSDDDDVELDYEYKGDNGYEEN